LDVQVRKKKCCKGEGKKIILQEVVELPEDIAMVNYEVTTSKKDFDDLLEGTQKRCSSRCLDLSPESHRPSSFWLDFSFGGSRKTSSFDSPGSH
jgi:hypothetical protein